MATPMTDPRQATNGVAGDAQRVAEHASSIAKLEVELARLELKQKVTSFSVGIGLATAAAVFGLVMLGFVFATIAAALAMFLSVWLALLLVTVLLLGLAGTLGAVALRVFRKTTPPLPEQAIREAKLTQEALRR
jgi:multisubunit Na+/H+ antiporter MnhE subunit